MGRFLKLVSVCLVLLPALPAAAQSSIGPLQEFYTGHAVTSSARAGSLAYFTTLYPTLSYPLQFRSGLLRSDGTPQGTFSIDPRGPVTSLAPIRFADSLGDLLFFTTATHSAPGDTRLWRSDGTTAGTFFVTEELALAMDNGAEEPPVILPVPERDLIFFSASPRTGSLDFELWATDGTLAGTRLVKDVNPEGSSNPRRMIAFDGRLFFFADTPQGRELWRSDGTPEGTERVRAFSRSGPLVQAGGKLFVLEPTESGVDVWRGDGTEAGTERVLELPHPLHKFQATDRHLFLIARDAAPNNEMWAVGGTGGAVRLLETAQEIYLLTTVDQLVFSLEDDHGREPWRSDGTPEGTHRIADLCPGPCSSAPNILGTYRGRTVLLADDGVSGAEPWLTDGTAAGTWRLGDFCPGECGSSVQTQEVNGWLALLSGDDLFVSDGTPDGAWTVGKVYAYSWVALPNRLLVANPDFNFPATWTGYMWSLPLTAPAPPLGDWMESPRLPGFRFKVQIGQILGRQESACLAKTLCVSGALRGRSEVFLRVAGPKPNGRLWPALVKLTTSSADVWIQQTATKALRHYRLDGSGPTGSILPGLLDREGFLPASALTFEEAKAAGDPQPPGRWIEATEVPGFRVQARLTSGGQSRILRKESCVAETFCLSGALPGTTELLIRVPGPKPNGYFWPTLARFTPAALEVWVQQKKTGQVRYYKLNAPPAGSTQLDGFFDRLGFRR